MFAVLTYNNIKYRYVVFYDFKFLPRYCSPFVPSTHAQNMFLYPVASYVHSAHTQRLNIKCESTYLCKVCLNKKPLLCNKEVWKNLRNLFFLKCLVKVTRPARTRN